MVPEAVLRFLQGFGRLIRTQADRGIVVLLDPRVRTKPYGRLFLDSLPECETVTESAHQLPDYERT
jgi:Rad3-related DNA helicase